MSFLKFLPTLRPPTIYTASFSSSVRRCAAVPPAQREELDGFYENLITDAANAASQAAESSQAASSQSPEVEDGPPTAPPDSYTRSPPSANPVTISAQHGSQRGLVKPVYAVSVKSSRNNTIITFARPNGQQLVTLTGGKLGFKKSNRNGYEAGYQCAVGIIGAMEQELVRTDYDWELLLSGFGQGRDAMLTAITTAVGVNVKSRLKRVTDRTPLKIGGTRGMKTRRV